MIALMSRSEVVTALRDDPVTDAVHQPYTAFCQGFDAYILRVKNDRNPYRRRSLNWRWWDMGYFEAQAQRL